MKDNIKIIIALILFCIASVIGKEIYHSVRKPVQKANIPTVVEDANAKYRLKNINDNVVVSVDNKYTQDHYEYNFPVSDSRKTFKENMEYQSDSQKLYQKQNAELIIEAGKAYGYIIAGDYKPIGYCAKYYPVNTYKQKFDARFKDIKIKAETILNKAYGSNGAINFKNSIVSNQEVVKASYQQAEDEYLSTKKLVVSDGIQNLTREQYCKMIDDNADFVVDEDYKKFKMIAPNF